MWTALAFVLGTAAFLYYIAKLYVGRNSDFWTKRGIPFVKNNYSFKDLILGQVTPIDFDEQCYKELGDKKYGGSLELGTPILYVKDLNLARNILVKDFDHFFDHRDVAHSDRLFSESLFFLEGQKWKDMRAFLSPTFTSGKIRRMFHHMEGSCKNMLNYIKTNKVEGPTEGYEINVPSVMRKLALEVIGRAVFGMDVDIFHDSNSTFYKMAEKLGTIDTERLIRFGIYQSFPKFSDLINLQITTKEVQGYFQGVLSNGLRFRESSTVASDDFLQLLVEAKRGNMKVEQDELTAAEKEAQLKPSTDGKKAKFVINEAMAIGQAFLFLVAGFETVSSNLSIVLYMLAGYPKMQEKVFAEVEEVIESTNGQINYEAVNRMEYMDMFMSEVMRLHPNVKRLERLCMEDYTIPETDKIIPKGTVVVFSAVSFHRDEKYYPDPLKFDPERFNAENKANRNPYSYMPFGIGPRNCIGMRFALIETKVALAQIVHNFIIEPTKTTPMPPKVVEAGFSHKPDANLHLRFVSRK